MSKSKNFGGGLSKDLLYLLANSHLFFVLISQTPLGPYRSSHYGYSINIVCNKNIFEFFTPLVLQPYI